MKREARGLSGVAVSQGTAEQVPPGGASDSHRHHWSSILGKPQLLTYLGELTFANCPAGSAALNGSIAYDTTNNRIILYVGGVRRASAAMAVV